MSPPADRSVWIPRYAHGTTSRYTAGCRCGECRKAGTLQYLRWQVRTAREGPQHVEATETRRRVLDLHALMVWDRVAAETRLNRWTLLDIAKGKTQKVRRATAQAIEAAWEDYCGDIEPDSRRLDAAPLLEFVRARYGSLKASGMHTRLHRLNRKGLTLDQADSWAARFGLLPHEIWPDYAMAA